MRTSIGVAISVIALVAIAGCASGSTGVTPTDAPQVELDTPEPDVPAEEEPAEEPAVEPEATLAPGSFEDGTWEVPGDIKPGTYRLREPVELCYWARLSGFSGDLEDIVANDNVVGYGIVTIGKSDKGFESDGCGVWSKDLSRVTASKTSFGGGTFIVKTDIAPGKYKNSGGDSCYWARLKGFSGQLAHIIANDNASRSTIVTIASTDKGFTSTGCGTWKKR